MPAKKSVVREIEAPNHFKREFDHLTAKKKRQALAILRNFMRALAPLLASASRVVRENCPKRDLTPCQTCAVQPGTFQEKGFAGTTYGFLRSLREVKPFFCHSNQPNWRENRINLETLKLCGAFQSLNVVHPEKAKQLAEQATQKLREL